MPKSIKQLTKKDRDEWKEDRDFYYKGYNWYQDKLCKLWIALFVSIFVCFIILIPFWIQSDNITKCNLKNGTIVQRDTGWINDCIVKPKTYVNYCENVTKIKTCNVSPIDIEVYIYSHIDELNSGDTTTQEALEIICNRWGNQSSIIRETTQNCILVPVDEYMDKYGKCEESELVFNDCPKGYGLYYTYVGNKIVDGVCLKYREYLSEVKIGRYEICTKKSATSQYFTANLTKVMR